MLSFFLHSFSFPIFLLFFLFFFSFPTFLLSHYSSPTLISQTSKPQKPKNKTQNKNWSDRKPKPKKKKKKNPHEEEKEERNSGVYEPPCRWFWSTSELQSLHWLGALRFCLFVCVFILLLKLKLKRVCCLLWVEMGLLFVVGLWVCWVSRFAWVCWFHCFSLGLSLGLLMNVLL